MKKRQKNRKNWALSITERRSSSTRLFTQACELEQQQLPRKASRKAGNNAVWIKSYYSNLYYLNLKTFVQGVFDKEYIVHKDYLKKDMGDVFARQPSQYSFIFDLKTDISDENRVEMLNVFFNDFIIPYSEKNMSVLGLRELAKAKEILLLPAVKDELDRLYPLFDE